MYNAIQLSVAALIAVAIIVIGCFYLASPERISADREECNGHAGGHLKSS